MAYFDFCRQCMIHFMPMAVLGRGGFGTVFRAVWHHPTEGPREVAIKYFETEAEKMEFNIERKQLARVRHPHIIQMFGACLQPFVSRFQPITGLHCDN